MILAAPAATIPIPCSNNQGWFGAANFLAVLAYPRMDPRSNAWKNQLVGACRDYLTLVHARSAGMRRITKGRAARTADPWILGSFRSHDWLRPTLDEAEAIAEDLRVCGFDPSRRIQLRAE